MTPAIHIPADDDALLSQCEVHTFRSGGPGGQHQNVTDSGVRLVHLPTGLVTVSRARRSQYLNKADALRRLRRKLEKLAAPPAAAAPAHGAVTRGRAAASGREVATGGGQAAAPAAALRRVMRSRRLRGRSVILLLGISLVAVVAGFFGSMLGVGGGIVMVPMLTLAFGVPVKTAIATSIVCVIATSSMAQTAFVARGMTHVRLGMLLEVATSSGAVAGGITAVLVDARFLQVSFAAVLVYVAWQMNRRGGDVEPVRTGLLESTFVDPATGQAVTTVCAISSWALS